MPATPIDAPPTAPARRAGPSPWPWMILGCALVAASGAMRIDQERRFALAERGAKDAPFPIRTLPERVGAHWQMDGEEMTLEEETQQIAGCSDYMYRQYVDPRTGVRLTVLVAFGPAVKVFPHSPLVCFPANGYQPRGGPWRHAIPVQGAEPPRSADFDALVYGRSAGGLDELREVFYSFWHDGQWSPTAEQTEHLFQHRPAMFKIQVERPITPGEAGLPGGPIEEFVAALVPEIERRLAAADGTAESDALDPAVAAEQ